MEELIKMSQDSEHTVEDVVLSIINGMSLNNKRPDSNRIYKRLKTIYDFSRPTCDSILKSLLKERKILEIKKENRSIYRIWKWNNFNIRVINDIGSAASVIYNRGFKFDIPYEDAECVLMGSDKFLSKDHAKKTVMEDSESGSILLIDEDDENSETSDDETIQKEQNIQIEIKDEIIDPEYEDVKTVKRKKDENSDELSDTSSGSSMKKVKEESLSPTQDEESEADEKTREESEADDKTRSDDTNKSFNELPRRRRKRKRNDIIEPLKKSGRISERHKNKKYDDDYVCPSLKRKTIRRKKSMEPPKIAVRAEIIGAPKSKKAPQRKCAVCHSSCKLSEVPVRCRSCSKFGHPSCVEQEQIELTNEPFDRFKWDCSACRAQKSIKTLPRAKCVCCITPSSKWLGSLIRCSLCNDHYHKTCITPKISNINISSWRCNRCITVLKTDALSCNKGERSSPNMVVIQGLHHTVSIEAIVAALEANGFTVQKCVNAVSRLKSPLNMFFVLLKDNPNNHKIYGLTRILATSVRVLRPYQFKASEVKPNNTNVMLEEMDCSNDSFSQVEDNMKTESTKFKNENKKNKKFRPKVDVEERPVPDPQVPDPTLWTTEEVADYFATYFDDSVSKTFIEQDVDGYALKLMRRSDVLQGMGFKLGLGLRVLFHVKRLQIRTNDRTIIWSDES